MGQVRRGLEMPASTTLDQFDTVSDIAFGQAGKCRFDIAVAGIARNFLNAERLIRRKDSGFNRTEEFVHQAALRTKSSANGSGCSISSLPWRASSSAATKLDANADRRYCRSLVTGRNASNVVQSSAWPSSAATRWIASSKVMTARCATTCIAGAVRAFTR